MSSASLSLKLFVVTTFITLIMYGLSLDQTYRYFRSYPKDALNLKFVSPRHVTCRLYNATLMFKRLRSYSAVLLAAEGQQSTEAILGLPLTSFPVFSGWDFSDPFHPTYRDSNATVTAPSHHHTDALNPVSSFGGYTSTLEWMVNSTAVSTVSGRSCLFVLMTCPDAAQGSALCGAFGMHSIDFVSASAFYMFVIYARAFDANAKSKLKQITYNRVIVGDVLLRFEITALGELSILIALSLFVNAKLIFHLHKARTAIASFQSTQLLASPSLFFVPSIQLLAGFERNAVLAAVNSRRSMVDRGSNRVEIQTVDLDGAQETRRSAISWARQPGHPMDTVATVELGALPRGSNSSPEAGIEEPQKVGTAL
ncbi:hypothetical protein LXA43DRAFT_1168977 [Ganoderma leucocontextum]|nr:hypothetical protein LXA43DRAFT_1168977 [Ganoderma leucocontextum]